MKSSAIAIALLGPSLLGAACGAAPAIAPPQDRPFPGGIRLDADATDVQRRVVHVTEQIDGVDAHTVLLFPKWLPGNHSTTGPIERFTGLKISAHGMPVAWSRDTVDMYAFHVLAPAGTASLRIEFDYLSPTSAAVDPLEISNDLAVLDWTSLILYPAGYYVRQIPVSASLRLPDGWQFGTALETASVTGGVASFRKVSVETLADSPVYAGRYARRLDLDPGAAAPVTIDLFADRPEQLAVRPDQLDAYRALVQQAQRLFHSRHYAHYDFLYALSDQLTPKGVEHHQSSEDTADPASFTDWDKTADQRELLPHEFTHSWNGKFRRPADLWTPNYNVPMQDSLLWLYEGQTEYWGHVLAARAGLWSRQQALDELALVAAKFASQQGRQWRPLQDTTNTPIINHHRPLQWVDWTRARDYYDEGELIWLDVDTLIRERSGGKRSLDDFARAFFGIGDGSMQVVTYTFDDVIRALNAVEPYDWAPFLRQRLDGVARPAPLDGLQRGGYRLVYTDKPSDLQKSTDARQKVANLAYSLGLTISSKDGTVMTCAWQSPAFRAGITESTQILAVNGIAYEAEVLADAIRAAQAGHAPIQLIVKTGGRFRVASVEYYEGLRYPHLERDPKAAPRLDDILSARAP